MDYLSEEKKAKYDSGDRRRKLIELQISCSEIDAIVGYRER